MREQYTTDAINLKSYTFGEADKIMVMYSKEKGIIKGIAKGIKKAKSKIGGRMDLFVANKIILGKGRNLDTICHAEALNTFLHIRNNYDKMFYSMYCSEIVANLGSENDPNSGEIYDLFYSFLNEISVADSKTKILFSVLKFQLKIAEITGYAVRFDKCARCAAENSPDWYFSVENGGVVCCDCASTMYHPVKIHPKITEFLKTVSELDFNEKSRFDDLVNEPVCEKCVHLLQKYIAYYSPKPFKTMQFEEISRKL